MVRIWPHTDEYAMVGEGQIAMLTSGEYSDYDVSTIVKFTKACNLKDLSEVCNKELTHLVEGVGYGGKEYSYTSTPTLHDFSTWLVKKGYCEEVEFREVHFD